MRSTQTKCRGRQKTENKQRKVHKRPQKWSRKRKKAGKCVSVWAFLRTRKKTKEHALKKGRAFLPKTNISKSRKACRVRTSPPSAPPHPQRLHRQHRTCGRLYRKQRSEIAGVPPEKQDFQKQENQADCLRIKYIHSNEPIKFASTLGVLVRLSFAGWGLAWAPHAAVS